MFRNFLLKTKPFVAVLLLTALIVPLLAVPKKIEAAAPVTIVGGWLPQLDAIIGTTAAETKQTFFQWTQTFVLEALKKRVLDLMVAEIVQWVQGNGDPKFITDWGGFLGEAANIAAGDLARQIGLSDLCSPFKLQIQAGIPRSSNRSPSLSHISCTLDDIIDNINDFYEDFDNGGWIAYQESWKPNNNFLSVYLETQSTRLGSELAAVEAAKSEALAGNGFLSTKSCTERVTFPGEANSPALGPDIDGDKIYGDIASSCSITTPGAVIGDLTKKAVGIDFDFIVNADQLADYVASIADALFNRLIRDGVNGLQGLTTKSAPSGGSIPAGTSGCAAFPFGSTGRATCEGYSGSNASNFNTMRDALITGLKKTRDDLIELRTAIADQKTAVEAIHAFISTESANESARCISSALSPYFITPSLTGVTSAITSIDARLQVVDGRIAELNAIDARFDTLTPETWADFTALTTELENKLPAFAVEEDEIDEAQIEAVEMEHALGRIKTSVSRCIF